MILQFYLSYPFVHRHPAPSRIQHPIVQVNKDSVRLVNKAEYPFPE
jgi:hypothetical protein